MTTTLKELAASETYKDIKGIIYDVAIKFSNRFGVDLDEVLSKAHFIYVTKACMEYDPTKASFVTCVHNYLWWYLMMDRRNSQLKIEPLSRELKDHKNTFHLGLLLDDLSNDAKEIANLILETPSELTSLFIKSRKKQPYLLRKTLRKFLSNLGWDDFRITTSFAEIMFLLH